MVQNLWTTGFFHPSPLPYRLVKIFLLYSHWRFWPFPLSIQFHTLLFVLIAVFHKNTPNTGCPVLGVHITYSSRCFLFIVLQLPGWAKASPFGRGVTKGDGEGKAGSKEATCAAIGTRLYQSDAIAVGVFSLFASLPSQALRASSPKGRAFQRGTYFTPPSRSWPDCGAYRRHSRAGRPYSRRTAAAAR